MFKAVKIVVYVPESHAGKVRECLADSDCGHIGNYDSCSFSMKGIGRFRALKRANPFIGEIEKIEEIVEERIETMCPADQVQQVISALKKVHPYEEPVIDVFDLQL